MSNVYLLFEEISDQLGTERVVGVFSTFGIAALNENNFNWRRTRIQEVQLDKPFERPAR